MMLLFVIPKNVCIFNRSSRGLLYKNIDGKTPLDLIRDENIKKEIEEYIKEPDCF